MAEVTNESRVLRKKLESLVIGSPDARVDFTDRLARENDWERELAEKVIREYKRLLYMAATAWRKLIPGICRYLVFMGCLAIPGLSVADEVSTRRYPLADRGTLELSVPGSWKQEVRQPPNDLPPTIVFTPSSGTAFHIQLTIIYPLKQGMSLPSVPDIKASVQVAADRAGMQSVEQQIPLQHLKGPASEGYYFRVTDKAPRPGEYIYMIQGMMRVGGVVPTFTILTNDGTSRFVSGALSMLKSARFIERK